MSSAGTAYNPDDPLQQEFLGALALGETGNSSYAATEGVGGVNLANDATTDQYGFPSWQGQGNSHAAGIFQFQPSTWDSLASEYGLNFSNPGDQEEGAWYLAQQTYANATGGQNLETALQNGDYQEIQSALTGVWPSVTGNQAAPQGLAADLGAGVTSSNIAPPPPGSVANPTSPASSTGASSSATGTGIIGAVENFFVRGGLILVGGIVALVALWVILSRNGVVPSPSDTARAVAHAV